MQPYSKPSCKIDLNYAIIRIVNDKKTSILVCLGIFGSVGVGLAMIIAGGTAFNFTMMYAGIGVLVGGIMLTVAILTAVLLVEYSLNLPHEVEPAHIVSDKPIEIPAMPKAPEKDVSTLMDKEDAFTDRLKESGKLELLQQYKAEADAIWENYTGENWDENLQQIDELIDKYEKLD